MVGANNGFWHIPKIILSLSLQVHHGIWASYLFLHQKAFLLLQQ